MLKGMAVGFAIAAMAGGLSACATTGGATGGAAAAKAPVRSAGMEGMQLDAALGRYGAWAEKIRLGDKQTYIWRRSYVAANQAYYCELWVETGFRQTISHTSMQGAPGACRLFSARLENRGD